jgi:hypothetical protein
MNNGLLDDCLVTFIERDIFLNVKEEDIINYFMAIRPYAPYEQEVNYNIFFDTLYVYKIFLLISFLSYFY